MNKVTETLVIDYDDPKYRITPAQQAAASCTGALLTSLIMTPLDVVKIRIQAQQKSVKNCFLYCNGLMDHICSCQPTDPQNPWYKRTSHFNGTWDAFLKISRNEGITSLWSGLSPTLVLSIPATICYFVTYEQLRLKLKEMHNKDKKSNEVATQPYWIPLTSGATARVVSVTIVNPLELIRTKMQSQRLSYLEMGEALKNLIKTDGIIGLWRGIFPTLLRDVPFSATYWMCYESIKSFYRVDHPSFWQSFIGGAVSGSVAATITVPFDVVKTNQQIEFGSNFFSENGVSEAEEDNLTKSQQNSSPSIIREMRSDINNKNFSDEHQDLHLSEDDDDSVKAPSFSFVSSSNSCSSCSSSTSDDEKGEKNIIEEERLQEIRENEIQKKNVKKGNAMKVSGKKIRRKL